MVDVNDKAGRYPSVQVKALASTHMPPVTTASNHPSIVMISAALLHVFFIFLQLFISSSQRA
jgi:hypothetical protein